MDNQEYEQKKRECWEAFKRENLDGEVQWQPVSRKDVFDFAFDRAYALGKQEIKQEIVLSGWVARNKDGLVKLFNKEPKQTLGCIWAVYPGDHGFPLRLPDDSFPSVTWQSEPKKVRIELTPIDE